MSRRQGAFDIVGSSTGLQGAFHLRQSETTSVSSGSKRSSIPELTRAEELAIKRASATFAPIGQQGGGNEQGRMANNDDDFNNWRPSDDWMMSMDRETGPRRTTDWDGDGIEVSETNLAPPVDLIPSHVRGSTPDSVVSTGKLRVSNPRGEHVDFTAGNLQTNANHGTDYRRNLAKSTRLFVQQMTEDVRPSTSAEDVDIEMRQRGPEQMDVPERYSKQEKTRLFLPKFILLLVVVMIALAGIVALIVFFKEDKPDSRGSIVPDPITEVECPSRSFSLNDTLNFTCTFNVEHEFRKILKKVGENDTRVKPKHLAFTGDTLDYDVDITDRGTGRRTFTFIGNGLTAKCSTEGSYDVIFLNEEGETVHIAMVTFSIKVSTLTTTFIQRQLTGNDCLKSEFDATCELHNDCNNYDISMFKRWKNGPEDSLNQYMTCVKNSTDADGYMVSCSATIPENLVADFVYLGCKMVTTLQNGQYQRHEKPFTLPSCLLTESCHTYIPSIGRQFNCSEKGYDIERLHNGTCNFPVLTNCFKPGRQIFSGIYKNHLKDLTCSDKYAVPVCRLSWCSDYNYVIKNEVPGYAICKDSYTERYLTPTTETPNV